jgi:SAM-dependent methyltransferase
LVVARARQWLAWALRPPIRSKPAQLRAVRRLKRSGALDPDLYLARNPDVAQAGIDPFLHYVVCGAAEQRSPAPSSAPGLPEDAMKRDWDARARADAMHFIASGRLDWNEESFAESGRRSVEGTIESDLERLCRGRDPAEMRMLEIGCGIGRMTDRLAEIFGEVHGVDVSGEMIARAQARLAQRRNVFLYETHGSDLAPFQEGFFDFAFSFIVFQHVPEKQVVLSNLREVHRVLKRGCMFKFQVQGSRGPAAGADTWAGVSFDAEELRGIASEIGFTVDFSEGEGTQYLWQSWLRN